MRLKLYIFLAIVGLSSVSGALGTMIVPSAERSIRMMLLVGDGAMIMLALTSVLSHRNFYGVRMWLLFGIAAILTAVLSSDKFGLVEQVNGMRSMMFFFATLIVVYDLFTSDLRDRFIHLMNRFIIVYAIAQIPFAIYQFAKYGANDAVGGTFGLAGGSGMLSQILFIICFYLMVCYASLDDGSHFKIGKSLMILPVLIPTLLNETKISFVLLPILLVLIGATGRKIYRSVAILAAGAVIVVLLNQFYSQNVQDTRNLLDLNYFDEYMVHVNPDTEEDLPRIQRLAIMFQMMEHDPGAITLGMGYGVLGGGSVIDASRMNRRLYYLVSGSRILLFSVWIQGGLLAVLIVGGTMFKFTWERRKRTHVQRRFQTFLFISLLVVWFYNEAMMERIFVVLVWFFVIWITEGAVDQDQDDATVSDEDDSEIPESQSVSPD